MHLYEEITADCFALLVELRTPAVCAGLRFKETHRRARQWIEAMLLHGLERQAPREDLLQMAHAIAVTADEFACRSGNSELRRNWETSPLALALFQSSVAPENFFLHLDSLRQDPRRDEVTRVHLRCLALGFQGQYGPQGGEEVRAIYDRVVSDLRARDQARR